MDQVASDFLLQLHRAARCLGPAEFERSMFRELRRCIDFDSGWWARGALADGLPEFHAYALDELPESLLAEYTAGGYARDDLLFRRTLEQPHRAVRCSIEEGAGSARLRAFVSRYRMEQAMAIIVVDPTPQILTGLALYRDDVARPFPPGDAARLELLAPHVADAWSVNRLQTHLESRSFRTGVLAPSAAFTLLQDGLAELLQEEWPDWRGPWPPVSLRAQIESRDAGWWCGQHISVQLLPRGDGSTLLRARPSHALDLLAPRKRAVALRFAAGAVQGDIAAELGLSASTVNNYLADVYRELGVADKAQLAILVRRLVE